MRKFSMRALLGSNKFFYGVLTLLIIQATWIAFSGRYAMAFDERFHVSIIQLYVDHISPIWGAQPDGPAPFGAVTRDPSFLYYWLMSFPYQAITAVLQSEMAQIIALRLTSIAMFAAGLYVYWRTFIRTGVSRALINAALAIFVLLPVVPFLAGQVNYDNMMFLIAGICFYLVQSLYFELKARKPKALTLIALVTSLCIGSITKYAFLPAAIGIFIWATVMLVRYNKKYGAHSLRKPLLRTWQTITLPVKIILIASLAFSSFVFIERYGINTIRYGTPTPECNQVLPIERCMDYSVWRRNYLTYQSKLKGELIPMYTEPVTYTLRDWIPSSFYKLFYTGDGELTNYDVGPPSSVVYPIAVVLAFISGVLMVVYWRVIRRADLGPPIAIALFSATLLWIQNYLEFSHVGYPYAIQGRYHMIYIPFLLLAAILVWSHALRKLPSVKAWLIGSFLVILITQGGGAGLFLVRSHPNWWWKNSYVRSFNETAQKIADPLMIDSARAPITKPYLVE